MKPKMKTRTPVEKDWDAFAVLAASEGWRVPALERKMFNSCWRQSARVIVDGGVFCGMVTAVAHERSGWIGNLIVPADRRGCGYGSRLFAEAVAALQRQDLASLWLTASAMGQPLYEKAGFEVVDRIERWVLPPRTEAKLPAVSGDADNGLMARFDRKAWGEDRCNLLAALSSDSRLVSGRNTVALLQKDPDLQVVGPWYSTGEDPVAQRQLLLQIVALVDPLIETIIDLYGSSGLQKLLSECGFEQAGENALMVLGDRDGIDQNMMVALASLGSIG
ncbi:MAG: hypothetical protein C0623_07710 [Desulfuromonas sp.]|nr:MAG: hypothetical protein C0623_07710 [Desulfuromonas sp.]